MKRILFTAFTVLFLTGCSWGVKEPIVETKFIEKPPLKLSNPAPVIPRDVEFIIITPETQDDVWIELSRKKIDVVLFGLTDKSYENISINLAELLRYIEEQNIIIKQYKDYYEGSSETSQEAPQASEETSTIVPNPDPKDIP